MQGFFKRGSVIAALALLSVFGTVPFALAAGAPETSCTCFCGTTKTGATQAGSMTATACESACQTKGQTFVTCALDATQYPSNFPRCFTKDACDRQEGVLDTAHQPLECEPGQFYCYPGPGAPTHLSVPIGGQTTVADYGSYIALIFSYGLGIAVTIAIVFVMIGGLQYVLAAGSGDVGKAKARIVNAVTGLVLLLGSYVILNTVNPALVHLQVPGLPMVKTVQLVGANSCEYLLGQYKTGYLAPKYYRKANGAPADSPNIIAPYDIDDANADAVQSKYGAQACGSVSVVKADGKGTAVADGITCTYESCRNPGERCVGQGTNAQCLKCDQVSSSNSYGLSLSEDLCNSLAVPDTFNADGELVQDNRCFYTHDPALLIGTSAVSIAYSSFSEIANLLGWSDEQTKVVEGGACASAVIDCTKITTCAGYDLVPVTTIVGVGSTYVKDMSFGNNALFGNSLTIGSLCAQNPCKTAAKPNLASCSMSTGLLTNCIATPPPATP